MRLQAALPEGLADDEADHHRLDPDARRSLLSASRATLDRLLIPARLAHRRRARPSPPDCRRTADYRRNSAVLGVWGIPPRKAAAG